MNQSTSTRFKACEEVDPEYLRMILVLANTSTKMGLGLHCSRCGQDLVGKNAEHDRFFTMECRCRVFIGKNPLPRPVEELQ